MRGFRKGISAFVAISLAIGSLAPALSLNAGAAIDGVDPSIDPTVNQSDKLPTDYDQAMAHDGMPNGMFVIGDTVLVLTGWQPEQTVKYIMRIILVRFV